MPGSARTCRACTASLAVLLSACAGGSQGEAPEVSAIVFVRGAELVYEGPISKDGNARLFDAADSAAERPRTLVITSTGGDVEAGIELGIWIFENRLEVNIPEYCISSCANYVFTAGRQKVLGPTALLIWHGGAMQEGLLNGPLCDEVRLPAGSCDEDAVRRTLAESLGRWQRLEAEFFARIGVEQDITALGMRPGYDCRGNDAAYIGWYYSIADMEKLGVTNVSVIGGDWQPTAPVPDLKFCRVAL